MNNFSDFKKNISKLTGIERLQNSSKNGNFEYVSSIKFKNYFNLEKIALDALNSKDKIHIVKKVHYSLSIYDVGLIIYKLKMYISKEFDISSFLYTKREKIKEEILASLDSFMDKIFLKVDIKIKVSESRRYVLSHLKDRLSNCSDEDLYTFLKDIKVIIIEHLIEFYSEYKLDAHDMIFNIFINNNLKQNRFFLSLCSIEYSGSIYQVLSIPIEFSFSNNSLSIKLQRDNISVNYEVIDYLCNELDIKLENRLKEPIIFDDFDEYFKSLCNIFSVTEVQDAGWISQLNATILKRDIVLFVRGRNDYRLVSDFNHMYNSESKGSKLFKLNMFHRGEESVEFKSIEGDLFIYDSLQQMSKEQSELMETIRSESFGKISVDSYKGTGKRMSAINILFDYVSSDKKVLYITDMHYEVYDEIDKIFNSVRDIDTFNPIVDLTNLPLIKKITDNTNNLNNIKSIDKTFFSRDELELTKLIKYDYIHSRFTRNIDAINRKIKKLRVDILENRIDYKRFKNSYLEFTKELVNSLNLNLDITFMNFIDMENFLTNKINMFIELEKKVLSINLNLRLVTIFTTYYSKNNMSFINLRNFINIFKKEISSITLHMIEHGRKSISDIIVDLDFYREESGKKDGFFKDRKRKGELAKYFSLKYEIKDMGSLSESLDKISNDLSYLKVNLEKIGIFDMSYDDLRKMYLLNREILDIDFIKIDEVINEFRNNLNIELEDNVLNFKNGLKDVYNLIELYQENFTTYRENVIQLEYIELYDKIKITVDKINILRERRRSIKIQELGLIGNTDLYIESRLKIKHNILNKVIKNTSEKIVKNRLILNDKSFKKEELHRYFNIFVGDINSVNNLILDDVFDLIIFENSHKEIAYRTFLAMSRGKRALILGDSSMNEDNSLMSYCENRGVFTYKLTKELILGNQNCRYAQSHVFDDSLTFLYKGSTGTIIDNSKNINILKLLKDSRIDLSGDIGMVFDKYSDTLVIKRELLLSSDESLNIKLFSLDIEFEYSYADTLFIYFRDIDSLTISDLYRTSLLGKKKIFIILDKEISSYQNSIYFEFLNIMSAK